MDMYSKSSFKTSSTESTTPVLTEAVSTTHPLGVSRFCHSTTALRTLDGGVDTISISYTADKDIIFSLPMDGTADTASGAAHRIILPKGTDKVVTVAIDQFKQPDWTEAKDSVKFDASKVTGISFEESTDDSKATTANIKITSIIFKGATIKPTPIVSSVNKVVKTAAISVAANTGILRATISLPKAENVSLSVVNTQGRIVAKQNLSLSAGITNVSLDLSNNAKGVYYLVAKGVSSNLVQKFLLQ